jgi:hypothetical protein
MGTETGAPPGPQPESGPLASSDLDQIALSSITRALLATRNERVPMYVDTNGDDAAWAAQVAELALREYLAFR